MNILAAPLGLRRSLLIIRLYLQVEQKWNTPDNAITARNNNNRNNAPCKGSGTVILRDAISQWFSRRMRKTATEKKNARNVNNPRVSPFKHERRYGPNDADDFRNVVRPGRWSGVCLVGSNPRYCKYRRDGIETGRKRLRSIT